MAVSKIGMHTDFLVETVTQPSSQNVGASSSAGITIDATKAGYKPVGIVSVTGSGTGSLIYYEWLLDGNNVRFRLYNRSSSSVGVKLTVGVLYQKV